MTQHDIIATEIPKDRKVNFTKPLYWLGNQSFSAEWISHVHYKNNHHIIKIEYLEKIYHIVVNEYGFMSDTVHQDNMLMRVVNAPETKYVVTYRTSSSNWVVFGDNPLSELEYHNVIEYLEKRGQLYFTNKVDNP